MSPKQIEAGIALILLLASAGSRALAQSPTGLDLGGSIEVGGEAERYLRVLQLAGKVPLTPWTIEPFSPRQNAELRVTGEHPWQRRFSSADSAASRRIRVLRPRLRLIENTTEPFQNGGGPTWAGRGLTGEIQAGAAADWRGLHVELAPLAFASQNTGFPLIGNKLTGNGAFGDPRFPNNIDSPQRFGTGTYARVAPGTSSIVLDGFHLAGGLTSAPQRWGPDREYPLVLGPNAGGFPMVFFGTDEPVNLWLFQLHTRVVYGYLGQSDYTALVDSSRYRLGSGIVFTMLPRGMPGLEIGASRFIHDPWTGLPSLTQLSRPFSNGLNLNGSTASNFLFENQVASVFARWALPAARAEFYGELYREDFPGHFHQALSLVEKPDDLASFAIGFQRLLRVSGQHISVLRAELVNGETSHQERSARGFTQPTPPYIHAQMTQGHTLDGLILGSPQAYGGAGWRVGVDEFSAAGRTSITLERSLQYDWLPAVPHTDSLVHPDVIYDIRAETIRFRGAHDVGLTLIPAVELNRGLKFRNDVFNLLAEVSFRGW